MVGVLGSAWRRAPVGSGPCARNRAVRCGPRRDIDSRITSTRLEPRRLRVRPRRRVRTLNHVQTRVGHRRATTTLDIYAQPTAAADRGAAEALGVHFLGSPRSDEPSEGSSAPPSRASRAMNARWMPSGDPIGHPGKGQETAPHQGEDVGGASKNRTCDLSIISAAL